jgi:outer membrane protein OmpA-like peptidoglycan-associated protein
MSLKKVIPAYAICIAVLSAAYAVAAAEDAGTELSNPPTMSYQATRGLPHTFSAKPMGAGRVSFGLLGSWYQQEQGFDKTPNGSAHIITGVGSFSFGVNSYMSIYASGAGFGSVNDTVSAKKGGTGTLQAGVLGALPLPDASPVFLGARLGIIGGTAASQINRNRADGYNYFETRQGYDFIGTLLQTLIIGREGQGVQILLNEGIVTTLENGRDNLLLLGGGIQVDPHPIISLGVEINSRTSISNVQFATDPLWLTPSLQLRTPFYFNVVFGSDISLSQDRADSSRALEPFRLFGGFEFSIDALAGKRRAQREAALRQAEERSAIERKNRDLQAHADSLTVKARQDSLSYVAMREKERLRADSLAEKARQDSIALADTRRKLEEEQNKRSDAEKQLLSTGLLLLDAVYFETGKTDVSINSKPYLTIIGKMLLKYPKLQIEVAGHTDNTGSMTKNMALSQARSEAVRFYLIEVAPALANRLTAHGYGPMQPKASNITADGRKVNRRVELQVLNKEVLKEYNQ